MSDRLTSASIKTRAEAIIDGDTKYFTGRVCVRGHIARRYVVGGQCTECRSSAPTDAKHEGYINVTEAVHRDDEAALRGYAESLRAGRVGE